LILFILSVLFCTSYSCSIASNIDDFPESNQLFKLYLKDQPSTQTLIEMAEHLIALEKKSIIKSQYSQKNEITKDSEGKLFFEMNCYGFFSLILELSHKKAAKELIKAMDQMKETVPVSIDGIPCPFNLVAIFQQADTLGLQYWTNGTVGSIERGDVLVYQFPGFKPSHKPRDGRGTHVMLISQVESQDGLTLTLEVIDCTRQPHNRHDSRTSFRKPRPGFGKSTVTLYQVNGQYTQLKWGDTPNAVVHQKEFTVGKLKFGTDYL